MSVPTVSVVMSVFNGQRFLCEAIDSILDQSFRDFELIVIDDGSTDGSVGILDSYQETDARVTVYHQSNKGLISSLNRGCDLARGKYVARMDADDVVIRFRLQYQVAFLEANPEVAVVGGAVEIINLAGGFVKTLSFPSRNCEIRSALLDWCPFIHPAVLIRRESLLSVGGYRQAVLDAEDYDLWLRMSERFHLANLAVVVLRYRVHPSQVSARKQRQMVISTLAARAAAVARRKGEPDPLDSISIITPSVLDHLGISEAAQHRAFARLCCGYIQAATDAHEYPIAISMLSEVLSASNRKNTDDCVLSDLRLLAARLYWHQRRFVSSTVSLGRAAITQPKSLGRLLR